MVSSQLADHPHDSPISSANDGDDWFLLYCELFKVSEAFFSIGSDIVEVEIIDNAV